MMRIYVASSWRNEARQQAVVRMLRSDGHQVYDFRHPPKRSGFGWEQLALGPPDRWSPARWRESLHHPIAKAGFRSDMKALRDCDACVLVLPCGRSAHLELGVAIGQQKFTAVLGAPTLDEPELMVKACDALCLDLGELRATVACWDLGEATPRKVRP